MQKNPESNEKKVTKEYYYEVPGVVVAESREEAGVVPEKKGEERKTDESIESLERKKPEKSEFLTEGELETGYTKESEAKPEEGLENKEGSKEPALGKEPEKSEFGAPGETETDHTKEPWEKPEKDVEEKETGEETGKDTEAGAEEKTRKETREEKRTEYTAKRRLTKSKKNRMLFGVCGGLGEYFDIDPTFIRLAFAILAFQGIGILLYIILALIMPPGGNVEMIPRKEQ